tara:strand:+ start:46 stop:306 length:261 start_codon:yes stop_codon:yes gene_type:complete
MILYEAYDCDEQRTYHSSKAAAIKAAREMEDGIQLVGEVTKINLGKIDQAKIISILNGGGYAQSQEVVWKKINGRVLVPAKGSRFI